ncbi:MAG: YbaK/EbsC family protein [Pseudomonadota bacterium]
MKSSNQKVLDKLESLGIPVEIKFLDDDVRTAALAATALGCEISQIANSLIFRDLENDQAVLIMGAGGHRIDLERVTRLTGLNLGKANADFVREHTGFAIGGVPPVGHHQTLRTLLDSRLKNHDRLWAAAGTPESIFSMSADDLQRMTSGEWLEIGSCDP